MPKVSILIPFRSDGDHRQRLWDHCRTIWQNTDYELVEGHDSGVGPFSAAEAFNDAAARATGDYLILFGADHIPDVHRVEWAVEHLANGAPWVPLYAETAGLTRNDTHAILHGYDPQKVPVSQVAPFCTAIIGIRSDHWIKFDERFQGWGGEDTAWRMTLESIYGPAPEPAGRLLCLWHEAAPRDQQQANFALIGEYITAQTEGRMREYVEGLGLLG